MADLDDIRYLASLDPRHARLKTLEAGQLSPLWYFIDRDATNTPLSVVCVSEWVTAPGQVTPGAQIRFLVANLGLAPAILRQSLKRCLLRLGTRMQAVGSTYAFGLVPTHAAHLVGLLDLMVTNGVAQKQVAEDILPTANGTWLYQADRAAAVTWLQNP